MTHQAVGELIGREAPSTLLTYGLYPLRPAIDYTKADYVFYDRLRRGKAKGYQLGGALAEPVYRIMQRFTFGRGVTVKVDENLPNASDINAALGGWLRENLAVLSEWYYEGVSLGDSYLGINPDGSLVNISPDQVELKFDPRNWRKVDEIVVRTVMGDKLQVTTEDRYTAGGRVLRVQEAGQAANEVTFPNFLGGRLPILHYAHGRSANEVYGHSVGEGLLPIFDAYENVLTAGLDGVSRMGRPIPVASGMEDPAEEARLNATSVQTTENAEGGTVETPVVDFTQLSMLWLGAGADFNFKAPPPFTGDMMNALQVLFYLLLQKTGIIEGVWGAAMNSSNASLDGQMPVFDVTVQGWQNGFTPFLRQAAQIWLAWQGVSNPRFRAAVDAPLQIMWGRWLQQDQNLKLAAVKYAEEAGLIRPATALGVVNEILQSIPDPEAEVLAAQAEARARFEASQEGTLETLANSPEPEDEATTDGAAA